jgi:hypothetical protein
MWTPEKHKESMKDEVLALKLLLKAKMIVMKFETGSLKNIIFESTSKDLELKMSEHSFYGYSRIACYHREQPDHSVVFIECTDKMYLFNHIKPIIERYFGIK